MFHLIVIPIAVVAIVLVDVTSPLLRAGLQGAVAAGLLTSARVAQVLDLAQVSP